VPVTVVGVDITIPGRDAAEAHVSGICFKTGPPRLLGAELEWTVHHVADAARPIDADLLARALHPHAPGTLEPGSPQLPLPHGGVVSVEPGGQVEISTPPLDSLATLHATVSADLDYLTGLLARAGLRLGDSGVDEYRKPHRLLHTPRYDAMDKAVGADGRVMMCSTAAIQVSFDAGLPGRVASRWAALHALGPVLLALFANSARHAGRATGWASRRMGAWLCMDPGRTAPVPVGADPAAAWARYAMDAPVLAVRRDGGPWRRPRTRTTFAEWIAGADATGGPLCSPPTYADLDYHLTTLFPPVRPRGYVEVRYLDQQPAGGWLAPIAVLVALMADESTVDNVLDLCASVAGRWEPAARLGLAEPDIAVAAKAVAELAGRRLSATGLPQGACDEVNDLVGRRLAAGASVS
jgi:glutamate--cysteine ligase